MRNIIFLDIDGVLNYEAGYSDIPMQFYKIGGHHYDPFHSEAKELLNSLIEKTNAHIVISSTWRMDGLDVMRSVWLAEGMSGEVIGITPSFLFSDSGKTYTLPRGVEIKHWLMAEGYLHINYKASLQEEAMKNANINNYIIIDDDSDMLYNQRNHFVHVLHDPTNKHGFNKPCYDRALGILSKSVVELNYR